MAILRDPDIAIGPLLGKTVAVIGFGSQGEAQARNLRDSNISVVVGVREGGSKQRALEANFDILTIADAVEAADVVAVLLPERAHKEVIEGPIRDAARPGAALVFAHGFTVLYGTAEIRSDLLRLLVAPKAIGPQLRRLYEGGKGAGALVAAEGEGIDLAKAYAKALGCGRRAVIESTFREEAETDLFGEQAVLCGGMPELARAGFETLVEAGYSPEAAYFECLFEIKLIADMMYEDGIGAMLARISDTAQFGAMVAGHRVVGDSARTEMRALLEEIRSGRFAMSLAAEQGAGMPAVRKWIEHIGNSDLDRVAAALKEKPSPR